MARSLNSEEAEVFSLDILATQKFPLISDSPDALLRRRDESLQLTPELGFWLGGFFSGVQGF
jgi:hypothetical protein